MDREHEYSRYCPERGASHSLSLGDYKKKKDLPLSIFFFCHSVKCCFGQFMLLYVFHKVCSGSE